MASLALHSILQELLKKRGLNVSELSTQTGIPRTTLQFILNGHTENPRIDTIIKLTQFFEVPINTFLGNIPNYEREPSSHQEPCSVPLLLWDQVRDYMNEKNNKVIVTHKYIPSIHVLSPKSFAVTLNHYPLHPLFSKAIILVDPKEKPFSGDFVLDTNNKHAPSIKQFIMENNKAYLISLTQGVPPLEANKASNSVAKIVQVIKSFQKKNRF